MSLFRRKHEQEDARDERPPELEQTAAQSEPELENARPDEERSPGAIVAPVAGEIVSGLVEVKIVPGEFVAEPALLEWKPADGMSWHGADAEEGAEEAEGGLLRWDTSALADGSYLLRLTAVLSAGYEVAGEPVAVLVDNLGPEIRLSEPLEGQTLSGFVTIRVEAEDSVSEVSIVELEISDSGGGWRRVADARREPFLLDWNSEDSKNGAHRLRIRARDGSGNLSLVGPLEVEIANAPAAAELVDPGEFLRGRVNLIARTPDLRSTQMIFELAKAGSSDWRALGTTRAPFHLSVDTGLFADGSYELRIESVTAEGQSVYSRRFGPYVVDNTPPAITIAKPAQGATLEDRAELVVEVADDASGPALVELSYNAGEEWITLAGLEPEEGRVRGFWQLSECRPGSCRLRAAAFDRAGNEASEEITVTIVAPAASQPERAPEPESTPPSQPRAAAVPTRPPSAAVAGRFGQVPSWDWKRLRPSGAEPAASAASSPGDEESVPQPIAEPSETAAPKEQARKSAAWTWKPSAPRSEPARETEERPEPEPKLEPKPEPDSELKPERELESEPEDRVELAEEQTAPDLRLVDPAADDKQEEATEKSDDKAADTGSEDGGRLVNVDFARAARGWDIWALSALVDDTPDQDPAREEERRQILFHLRQHTSVDGHIPPGFEDLIYEVFGELMPGDEGA